MGTWITDIQFEQKLIVKDADNKNMKLHVNTLKIEEKDDGNKYRYELYGKGTSPFTVNDIEFEGEYRPFDEDENKNNIDLTIKCKNNELKLDIVSWSAYDKVEDGLNKSHLKIANSDN